MTQIQQTLFSMQDKDYRDFQCRLMPTVPKEQVIGVRTPLIREYAKTLYKNGEYSDFLQDLPHAYYEENNLHGALLCKMKDFPSLIAAIDRFLPYVNNWATCDMMHPKLFAKHTQELLPHISRWLSSEHPYTVRFGIEMLMNEYLDEHFEESYLTEVSQIRSEEYYVNMMIAWYFATALAKQYDAALPYLENKALSPWVHNKTIQKAVESYRITKEQKDYLKTLRIK